MYSGKNGCIRAKVILYCAKVVVFGQSGCIMAVVAVFSQKWLYSGQNGCIFAKEVVFGQIYGILTKYVIFLQSFCIREKWLYSGKVAVFGQKWF